MTTNNVIEQRIKGSFVESVKTLMPKPESGIKLSNRIKKIGLTVPDLAYLINRSTGGLYNMFSPNNERYKHGNEGEDLVMDIVVSYLEKLYEERRQRIKEQKAKEKEKVFNIAGTEKVISTSLSLKDCKSMENKLNILESIQKLSAKGETISYKKIADMTGLTAQQIAKIREQDEEINEHFKYTNEVEFNDMQKKLVDIVNNNVEDRPNIAINAIRTSMEFTKSNQKDKGNNFADNGNIWEQIKNVSKKEQEEGNVIEVSEVEVINN